MSSFIWLNSVSSRQKVRGFVEGGGVDPEPPPPGLLIGVGSYSDSLEVYPRVQNTTVGNWYVDASRPSSGNGQSLATAFRTIQEGLSALQSGQTLLVKGGTYNVNARFNRITNWSQTTRIMGYGDDRPVINASGFTTANDAILRFQSQSNNELWHRFYIINVQATGSSSVMVGSANTTLSDIWCSHSAVNGIFVGQGNANVRVQDCVVWRLGDGSSQNTNTGDCFAVTAWTSGVHTPGTRLIRCVGINGPDDGYDLWGGQNCEIIDCVAGRGGYYWTGVAGSTLGGDGSGFKLGGAGGAGGHSNTIRGSLVVGSRLNGFQHNLASPNQNMGHTYLRNTSYANGSSGFDLGNNFVARDNINNNNGNNNIHAGSGGTQSNNTWNQSITNPQFADVANHDYSLLPGSPAIGSGVSGGNLGASTIALENAKIWLNRNLNGYADPAWNNPTTPPVDPPDPPPGETTTLNFSEDTTSIFLNPERGWMGQGDPTSTARANGWTVVWVSSYQGSIYRLDDFRNSAISEGRLDQIRNHLAGARSGGVKIKMRFQYNGNPVPPEGYQSMQDASLSRILQHIDQVGPILEEYADVIVSHDLGWFGAWGENHSSSNGHSDNNATGRSNRLQIYNRMLSVLPNTRGIGFRYPPHVRDIFPEYDLPRDQWFTGTSQARAGWLNDCFVSSSNDVGTYSSQVDRETFRAIGRYTAGTAETCSAGGAPNQWSAGAAAIAEMERVGIDILNAKYFTGIINNWISTGHYNEISRRLGYRISVVNATVPTSVSSGTSSQISITWRNSGFGKLFNPRPLRLVFTGQGGPRVATLAADCRSTMPIGGETMTSNYTFTVPSGLVPGEKYNLHLWLPDGYESLQNDVRYTVRLANTGSLWNGTTGYNSLNYQVDVV